jgi:hypothetical protein
VPQTEEEVEEEKKALQNFKEESGCQETLSY